MTLIPLEKQTQWTVFFHGGHLLILSSPYLEFLKFETVLGFYAIVLCY